MQPAARSSHGSHRGGCGMAEAFHEGVSAVAVVATNLVAYAAASCRRAAASLEQAIAATRNKLTAANRRRTHQPATSNQQKETP